MGFAPPGILSPLRLPISPPEPMRRNITLRTPRTVNRQGSGYFPAMIRRFALAAVLLTLVLQHARGQLPLITVPQGALRIDLAGSFYPNDRFWDNGATRPLSATLDGASTPLVAGLQAGLAQILGQPVSGLSLGVMAAREHGVGNIGLAFGLTRRITVFGTVPLVFVRSRMSIAADAAPGRVGLNPGGDVGFFGQFDAALSSLAAKVQRGDYAGDATTLALAQQTLASGSALRSGLFTLLADPTRASPVLPTSGDPYGVALLSQVAALQSTLSDRLDVPEPFTLQPALPATALTTDEFAALLGSPTGFGLSTSNKLPALVLGDVEAGVAVELAEHGAVGGPSWSGAWLRFTGRFPTGSAASPAILLDQGSGDKHPALQLDGILEVGRHRVGLRGEATYQHQLALNSLQRITPPDAVLVPASFIAAVHSQPGDSFAVTVRPSLQFAPHFAIVGMGQYWWRGASRTGFLDSQSSVAGVDPAQLDIGSAANAVVVGIGLSYAYTGASRDGTTGLPVEAGWSIERTLSSGRGIFPDAMTSRVSLRIYRPLVKH
jgi:hypothetical protein